MEQTPSSPACSEATETSEKFGGYGSQKAQVKRFLEKLDKMPRLCSPTICGTLSQPIMRNKEHFDWSLEQKAMMSPANITVDTDPGDWHSEMDQTWRQHESEVFFSQKTIAPSPLVEPVRTYVHEEVSDEDDDAGDYTNRHREIEDETHYDMEDDDDFNYRIEEDDDDDDSETHSAMEDEDDDNTDIDNGEENDIDADNENNEADDEEDNNENNLFFSPQPFRSSQTQQRMDIFSPGTFSRVMEDENTLQSTPKTTGGSQRVRARTRQDMMD